MATTTGTPCLQHVRDLLLQVADAVAQRFDVLCRQGGIEGASGDDTEPTAVRLQRTYRRYQHGCVRLQAAHPALDVEELLRAQVGAEAGLGDEHVGEPQPDLIGHDRRVAVGDVAEWAGVHKRRRPLKRLEQIRLEARRA